MKRMKTFGPECIWKASSRSVVGLVEAAHSPESVMLLEGSHDDTGLHAEEQKDKEDSQFGWLSVGNQCVSRKSVRCGKDSPTSSHSSCPSKQSGRGAQFELALSVLCSCAARGLPPSFVQMLPQLETRTRAFQMSAWYQVKARREPCHVAFVMNQS